MDPVAIGSSLAFLVVLAAAFFERHRSAKMSVRAHEAEAAQKAHDLLISSKDDLYETARLSAAGWKERFEDEHKEYKAYREATHVKAQDTQNKMLEQAEEIASLRARTDITPVMETLAKIVKSLEGILTRLDHLSTANEEHESRPHPKHS
jgi:septin family protein